MSEHRQRRDRAPAFPRSGREGVAVSQRALAWREGVSLPAVALFCLLVIGLAATSDEHIRVLARLGTILGDEGLCRRLGSTRDAGEIYRTLTSTETDDAPPSNGHPARSDEIERELKITNPHGLHARPAANVVDRVRPFDAEVSIHANGRKANARSITALLGLGAAVGDDVRIVARGADAESAAEAVAAILTSTIEG